MSSRRSLECEAEAFEHIEETHARRVAMFVRLRRCAETAAFQHRGRWVSKIRLFKDELVLGTVDGCVSRFGVSRAGISAEKDSARGCEAVPESTKICDVAIQNIFRDSVPIFLARDGCVHVSPLVYKTGILVQQSDYHSGLGLLMATDEGGNVFAHDLKAQKPVFRSKMKECTSLQIHEDGNVFLCSDGAACFVDIRSMKTIVRLGRDVAVSVFQNSHVICAAADNAIHAFDLRSLDSIGHVLSHRNRVHFLEASDGVVYSGSLCGDVCISSPSLSMIHRELGFSSVEGIDACDDRMAGIEGTIFTGSFEVLGPVSQGGSVKIVSSMNPRNKYLDIEVHPGSKQHFSFSLSDPDELLVTMMKSTPRETMKIRLKYETQFNTFNKDVAQKVVVKPAMTALNRFGMLLKRVSDQTYERARQMSKVRAEHKKSVILVLSFSLLTMIGFAVVNYYQVVMLKRFFKQKKLI
ncbi:UNVERIFIED_CONTAM: hypothetical protein PYX00_011618 [Menopon gallinae]|uniref:GOLD domain-containing protein n=1 Tax=Menopon gallinae TaxID=328185 RepID=A0AAW2H868_9NEOP